MKLPLYALSCAKFGREGSLRHCPPGVLRLVGKLGPSETDPVAEQQSQEAAL